MALLNCMLKHVIYTQCIKNVYEIRGFSNIFGNISHFRLLVLSTVRSSVIVTGSWERLLGGRITVCLRYEYIVL
jgi:hypothetical protein